MSGPVTSRRAFLRSTALATGAWLISACATAPAARESAALATVQSGSSRAGARAPADKRTLVVSYGVDINALDPYLSTFDQDVAVSFNMFDNLTSRSPDLKLIPRLATDWRA